MQTTLLVTVTAFDDRSCLAYSLHTNLGYKEHFSPINQVDASPMVWEYLLGYLFDTGIYDAIRIAVVDRRPGTRATSRCCGHSLT